MIISCYLKSIMFILDGPFPNLDYNLPNLHAFPEVFDCLVSVVKSPG